MPQRLHLAAHLSAAELRARFLSAQDPTEKIHWQALYLVSQGRGSADIAAVTGYTVHWIRKLVVRYREGGPAAMSDGRHHNPGQDRLLTAAEERALATALEREPEDGGLWSGPKVAAWITERIGKRASRSSGWKELRRLGFTPQRPRRRHAGADPAAQERFPA